MLNNKTCTDVVAHVGSLKNAILLCNVDLEGKDSCLISADACESSQNFGVCRGWNDVSESSNGSSCMFTRDGIL